MVCEDLRDLPVWQKRSLSVPRPRVQKIKRGSDWIPPKIRKFWVNNNAKKHDFEELKKRFIF